jgi:UDP-N-acetylglucosamine 2-epimerase (non-hydrolysing)
VGETDEAYSGYSLMKTILSVASARPNFVKLAAVHHALAKRPDEFTHVIVHTGQHYDPLLSDIFFEQLEIPDPDVNLGIHGGTRVEVINATAAALTPVLQKFEPDVVLVYGDVNGAVGAARAASILGLSVAHVEAGLRSGDLDMPEEHNRIEIDALADLLFCSEQSGMDRLEQERNKNKKYLVGNTMIDTLIRLRPITHQLAHAVAERIETFPEGKVAIATLHRPSNVDNPVILRKVMQFFTEVAAHCPVMLAAHPRLQQALEGVELNVANDVPLIVTPPMGYLEFLAWVEQSAFILTDSGGIQEEAAFLGKRCFTLRRNTERPSTIDAGSNILINPDSEYDRQIVLDFAKHPRDPHVKVPALWDGKAGERIVEILAA